MLRSFLRLMSRSQSSSAKTQTKQSANPSESRTRPTADHRARVMSMRLEHIKICGKRRCEELASFGLVTAGDLATCDPQEIRKEFKLSGRSAGRIKRYRRIVRLSASVPNMMPRDAQLLVAIHRRSVRAIALEDPAVLHRDIERFLVSSLGRRMLRGRRIPGGRRVREWVSHCKLHQQIDVNLTPSKYPLAA